MMCNKQENRYLKFIRRKTFSPLLIVVFSGLLFYCKSENSKNTHEEENKETAVNQTDEKKKKVILFYGNSITAGYGLELSEAFPALIQEKLDSLRLDYTVVNAGLSGETSAGGISRLDWVLKQRVDIFVLELGANDGLRGINPDATKKNLQKIIEKVKAKFPQVQVILAGMEMPPSMGNKFTQEFKEVYKQLAKENNLPLIPFLLAGVGGEPRLNLSDGIHPTAEGHKILAENVWAILKDELQQDGI